MKGLFTACWCLAVFLSAAAQPKPQPETLIFTNVNVVNTRQGGVEPGVTVVITRDRITGVGESGFCPRAAQHPDYQCQREIPDPRLVGYARAQRLRVPGVG